MESKKDLQAFIDASWPFIERAMECEKHTVLCGRYPDHVKLHEAGGNLTVGDLRKLRDAYLKYTNPCEVVGCQFK